MTRTLKKQVSRALHNIRGQIVMYNPSLGESVRVKTQEYHNVQNGSKGDDCQTVYPEGLILQLYHRRYCTPFVNAGEESSRWAQTAILANWRGSMNLGWFSDNFGSFRMAALLLMNAQRKSRAI